MSHDKDVIVSIKVRDGETITAVDMKVPLTYLVSLPVESIINRWFLPAIHNIQERLCEQSMPKTYSVEPAPVAGPSPT